jgi:hypothetical protein
MDSPSPLISLRRVSGQARAPWIALLLAATTTHAGELRTFRSADGRPLKASFEGMAGNLVKLRREDGRMFDLPLEKLSAADQTYLKDAAASAGNEAKTLNTAAGQEIADGSPFQARKAEDLARALKLPKESTSRYGASWRLYAAFAKDYRLFGAMPYSVALYSDAAGLVTSLSIVYANKGDFGSTAGFGADHFGGGTSADAGSLADAMSKDEETVTKALTSALGPGKPQRYGEGDTRRKITRWDWNGHAFLLSNEENEYVGLSIVATEYADAGGKSLRVKDGEVKQRLLDSIVKKENGDVYLSEIPMVDQGPKGYCVPATFERAMRTMGLEADMYLLAMVGQSRAGGGTSVELLLENVRSQVYRKGRRTKDDELKQLRIRDLRRYIDQGIPVMWTMHSVDAYNDLADSLTAKRAGVTDWKAYAEEIQSAAADITSKSKPDDKNHICMIIGYNETTQEIAVSDSWGARFERRWIPVSVADWASQGSIFMILP